MRPVWLGALWGACALKDYLLIIYFKEKKMIHIFIVFNNCVIECVNLTHSALGYDIYQYDYEELYALKHEFPQNSYKWCYDFKKTKYKREVVTTYLSGIR